MIEIETTAGPAPDPRSHAMLAPGIPLAKDGGLPSHGEESAIRVTSPLRRMIEAPGRLAVVGLVALFAVAAATLALTAWRNGARLDAIIAHAGHSGRIASAALTLQYSILEESDVGEPADPEILASMRRVITALRSEQLNLDPTNLERLDRLAALLASWQPISAARQAEALGLVRELLETRRLAEGRMLERLSADARRDFQLGLLLLGALVVLVAIAYRRLNRRVLGPITSWVDCCRSWAKASSNRCPKRAYTRC